MRCVVFSAGWSVRVWNTATEYTFEAVYEDMAELIRLGAYKAGTNVEVDMATKVYPKLEAFLTQKKEERATLADGYAELEAIMAELGSGS